MRFQPPFALSLGLLVLFACGGGGGDTDGSGGGITLSAPSSEVVAGFSLDVVAASSDPQNATLVWTSSSLRTASVDQDGRVLGCAEGLVTITARSPATGARGTIALRVLPDTDFNHQLPIDGTPFAPTVERACTVERCEVTLRLTGIAATVVQEGFRSYHQLQLPMSGLLGDVGKPELPVYTMLFAIPVDPQTRARATYSIEVQRESPLTYPGIRPWPHQPPAWFDGESEEADATPPFEVDEAAYGAQAARPAATHWAETSEIGNLPMLEVRVAPLRYLPASHVLELFETTRVIVTFTAPGQLVMPRPLGDYKGIQERGADELLADYVQNRDLLSPVAAPDLSQALPPIDGLGYQDLPFDLLIVTRPSLEAPARDLAKLRQGLGTRVWLAVLDETTYPDADAVLDMIRTLDDLNIVVTTGGAPRHIIRALLIFGDVEHIPTFEGRNQRNNPTPRRKGDPRVSITGTDLPYSAIRGVDTHADFACGRISVDDVTQAATVVTKITTYESRPLAQRPYRNAIYGYFEDSPVPLGTASGPVTFTKDQGIATGSGTAFLSQLEAGDLIRPNRGESLSEGDWEIRVSAVSNNELIYLQQDWTEDDFVAEDGLQVAREDGRENKMFVMAAERVREFMISHSVDTKWGYTRTDDPIGAPLPTEYHDGRGIHTDFATYLWDLNADKIEENWIEGKDGIILHSGHGGATGWSHPRYVRDPLPPFATDAGPWCPIVFSINCNTGFFDSETDRVWSWNPTTMFAQRLVTNAANGYGSQHEVSFCEQVLRSADGGGVAIVGASRGTTAGYNARLIDGLYAFTYDDYWMRGLLPGTVLRPPGLMYLGDIVNYAKRTMYLWVASEHGADKPESAEFCLQTYHLFGDPMLRVRPPAPAVDD